MLHGTGVPDWRRRVPAGPYLADLNPKRSFASSEEALNQFHT